MVSFIYVDMESLFFTVKLEFLTKTFCHGLKSVSSSSFFHVWNVYNQRFLLNQLASQFYLYRDKISPQQSCNTNCYCYCK